MSIATTSGPYRWLAALLLAFIPAMANSIEEPKFELLAQFDDIEIRRYAPTIQAVTAMPGYSSGGFRRLAGYIFGGNDKEQSIAMTAPVQETMTGSDGEMAFTLPSEYALDDLPSPDSDTVELRPVPERLAAGLGLDLHGSSRSIPRSCPDVPGPAPGSPFPCSS